ncbi:hypothetical protein BS50DRAFT_570448 [Corynespora cassiicola Philippines]|uniref:Uncharacterized protein n=1 Tax=Corynespora cassiicola Philippines TaxID=1448308 RepID=A0A2T2P069_CORCC|nr:hypothetical protein BS50DRAFT_570448 [Corynespora cassiicola Philippines]
MDEYLSFAYPLQQCSDAQLQNLGRALWDWELCGKCSGQPHCKEHECPWFRANRLRKFWAWYRNLTAMYVPELHTSEVALRKHEDIIDIIQLMRSHPDTPRAQLMREYFTKRSQEEGKLPAAVDRLRAFNIVGKILYMVNCACSYQSVEALEYDLETCIWRNDMTANQFIIESFPMNSHPYFSDGEISSKHRNIKSLISAMNLKKKLGLRFEPTSDLKSHLKLDQNHGILYVFDCTAVLKEYLLWSHETSERKKKGMETLPRLLVLEAMDTIHKILFPPGRESHALLSLLVSRHKFDEDCLRYESARYRDEGEVASSYPYFGARLAELYDELQTPTPRGKLHTWLERKSGSRYVMMVTMVGVLIAIVIGLLSLGVSGFQAWVTYQQWKHPISGDSTS